MHLVLLASLRSISSNQQISDHDIMLMDDNENHKSIKHLDDFLSHLSINEEHSDSN